MNSDSVKWWQALNPAIYLISILPAFAILILADGQGVWFPGLVTATVAVVMLQHSINLFNDVSDWTLGADAEKYDSWVRVHDGETRPVLIHGVISLIIGGVLGLAVLILSDKLWILFIATPLMILGYLYNAGERPLSYTWMGEWVTGICYGGVFFCLWLVADLEFNVPTLYGTALFAALAMSLLLSHQPPQIETDRKAGKHSFAVRYGSRITVFTSFGLLVLAMLFMGAGVIHSSAKTVNVLILLAVMLLAFILPLRLGITPKSILLSASSAILLLLAYS